MKKLLLIVIFINLVFANVDYSEMSTEELIAIMGYVAKNNEKKLDSELKSRVKSMSKDEKKLYEKNFKKNQNK